ncbi:MAG: Na(+)/H(+) antiporter subunit D [Rhodospirillaceae bacterium]|jgi:multicomponent Na+:H+ antiporter subunit D|nr:Na(+)/H(+) antiporter subunit D [Rhodospirillaceae bacterium]MBT4703076.1 Na(+)/H(+) antiporter subunit D [Rhodospirillaceae bacterium]MBT5034221.1 Na(+)/H(+) antiporter subunit D [Rhodospirillaceae bacterium]MBT8005587.1 Na(+)/H(+) antiporter subunit D [Rhodospirillales bacterium]
MMSGDFPPGIVLILGAFLLPFVGKTLRPVLILGLPLITLALVWRLTDGASVVVSLLQYELILVRSDSLSRLFATIFSIMAFGGGLFALKQEKVLELVAAFVYAGCAISVALAGDLISLFVYWEIMAVASTMVVISVGAANSNRTAMRYFLVHMFGGALLMTGIVIHIVDTGSTAFAAMEPTSIGTMLILAGFLINAAAPPLSAWLADAYPEASYSGTVFLSAFTTKAAVYVLIRGFPGAEILIYVGVFMIFYGIIYALLENDMRRILAYSIVNQVGFMVTAVGIGTEMALNGAAAHAFTHIIYKALLLMSAGAVLYQTGKRKCTDLGGLFQSMPLTMICGVVGALSISSFPLTSGFISKSMISQAASDEKMFLVWMLLMAASAGVFLHAGIKFPWFVFFQKDSGLRPKDPPWNMRLAMILFSGLCIGLGIWPEPLYAILPFTVNYVPYTVPHVVNMLQLLLFSGLAFFLMLPMMKRTLTISLDVDWLYRKLLPVTAREFVRIFSPLDRFLRDTFKGWIKIIIQGVQRQNGPEGLLAQTEHAGHMAQWMVVLLAVYLVLNFL